ncbi:hypothetical protein D3C72_2315970 [compost metagenome]
MVFDGCTQPLGHGPCALGIGIEKNHHEFFAARTAGEVSLTQSATNHTGHSAQSRIARLVTMGVIDAFEVIDVQHQQMRGSGRA